MKLCSRLLMFLSKFPRKNDKFWYLNPILGKLGVTHDLGWWLIGKPMVSTNRLSIGLMELSSLSVTVPELRGEIYTARLFSTYFHSNFTWAGASPVNHSWHQKTRDTGLPDGEDRILLCSRVLTQYRSVTDRWTDVFAIAYKHCSKKQPLLFFGHNCEY